jgi:hypothetical protein
VISDGQVWDQLNSKTLKYHPLATAGVKFRYAMHSMVHLLLKLLKQAADNW